VQLGLAGRHYAKEESIGGGGGPNLKLKDVLNALEFFLVSIVE
jgi:hypothetical protein